MRKLERSRPSSSVARSTKTDFVQHRLDFGIGQEQLPDQAGAIVFDHYRDWSLIQAHVDGRDPVGGFVEGVAGTVDVPDLIAEVAIEMFAGGHGRLRRVREGSQGA